MIEKGANNWNWGLHAACRNNHPNIVQLMIEKGADDWNEGLCAACRNNHPNIIQLMIEKGADYCSNCDNEKHNFS